VRPEWTETIEIGMGPIVARGRSEEGRELLLRLVGEHGGDRGYARWCHMMWTPGFLVDGCPAGNLEMSKALHGALLIERDLRARGECCGGTPTERGYCERCPHSATDEDICPLVRRAGKIVREEMDE
jgi:hypothetical protein